ncbi:MAG TPA: amidohydrolase family protein [Candidatus Binataceae bacterium]|nr:amidohydrolase family protein [Candidatus Binataceae bacterium]
MAEFDTVIKNGMVIDGTRLPRFRGDIGIKDGKVARIGRLQAHEGAKVIDAGGLIVAPGFVDLHTHYDAQLFWDPYCSISSWHGVTSIVIGNCGFGFAPVPPDFRERAMLTMTRNEAIPYASMKAGMPWDWVTYPEFLDSVDRRPKAINILPFVPLTPLLIWVMGLDEAKTGRRFTEQEEQMARKIVNEAMDAGACGWSLQHLGRTSIQPDYDGSPMVTDIMDEENILFFGRLLAERNEGFIQMTYVPDNPGDIEGDQQTHIEKFHENLAEIADRPILYNAIAVNDKFPGRHRRQLNWLERCRDRGLKIYGQSATVEAGFAFTFADWNLWEDVPAWKEATIGNFEARLQKLGDPDRRPALRDCSPVLTNDWKDVFIITVKTPEFKQFENMNIVEAGKRMGKHPVDAMLDIAVADGLATEFYSAPVNTNLEGFKELASSELTIPGVSDGGAHTKFFMGGVYPTEYLMKVRDSKVMSLEAAHWRLSTQPALCAGFKNRGTLREGTPADIVIYDLEKLAVKPMEIAHDFPGGEWRRVKRAEGYHKILVNGEVTLEDGKPTAAMSGKLLRYGA